MPKNISPILVLSMVLAFQAPCLAASKESAFLNNEAFEAMQTENFQLAIDKLQRALILDPNNILARKNMGIACNNLALTMQDTNPIKALRLLHQAAYVDPSSSTTRDNLAIVIRLLNKDPKSQMDRVYLAESAAREGDQAGAIVEYLAALSIHEAPSIRSKLNAIRPPSNLPLMIYGSKPAR